MSFHSLSNSSHHSINVSIEAIQQEWQGLITQNEHDDPDYKDIQLCSQVIFKNTQQIPTNPEPIGLRLSVKKQSNISLSLAENQNDAESSCEVKTDLAAYSIGSLVSHSDWDSDSMIHLPLIREKLMELNSSLALIFYRQSTIREFIRFYCLILLIQEPALKNHLSFDIIFESFMNEQRQKLAESLREALNVKELNPSNRSSLEALHFLATQKEALSFKIQNCVDFEQILKEKIDRMNVENGLKCLPKLLQLFTTSMHKLLKQFEETKNFIHEFIENERQQLINQKKRSYSRSNGNGYQVVVSKIKLPKQKYLEEIVRCLDSLNRIYQHKMDLIIQGVEEISIKGISALENWLPVLDQQIHYYCEAMEEKVIMAMGRTGFFTTLVGESSKQTILSKQGWDESVFNPLVLQLESVRTFNTCLSSLVNSLEAIHLYYQHEQVFSSPDHHQNWVFTIDGLDDWMNENHLVDKAKPKKKKKKVKKLTPTVQPAPNPTIGNVNDQKSNPLDNTNNSSNIPPLPIHPFNHAEGVIKELSTIINRPAFSEETVKEGFHWLMVGMKLIGEALLSDNRLTESVKHSTLVRMRLKFSQEEIRDHALMALCGLNVFAQAVVKADIPGLSLAVPMLVVDWFTQAEKIEDRFYMANNQEIYHRHQLVELAKKNRRWEALNQEMKIYYQDLNHGLIWYRYLKSSSQQDKSQNKPKALKAISMIRKLNQKWQYNIPLVKQDIGNLQEIIQYVIQAQQCSFHLLHQTLAGSQNSLHILELLNVSCAFVGKLESFLISQIDKLKSKPLTIHKTSDNQLEKEAKELEKDFFEQERAIEKWLAKIDITKFKQKQEFKSALKDAVDHIKRLRITPNLLASYSQSYLTPWHCRNVLSMQWALELLYISQCLACDLKFLRKHDFKFFQTLLYPNRDEPKLKAQLDYFNVGKGFHYPSLVNKEKGQPLVKKLKNLINTYRDNLSFSIQDGDSSKINQGQQEILNLLKNGQWVIGYEFKELQKALEKINSNSNENAK